MRLFFNLKWSSNASVAFPKCPYHCCHWRQPLTYAYIQHIRYHSLFKNVKSVNVSKSLTSKTFWMQFCSPCVKFDVINSRCFHSEGQQRSRSFLFVTNAKQDQTRHVDVDLNTVDIDFGEMKENLKARGLQMDVDTLMADYKSASGMLTEIKRLEAEGKDIAMKMSNIVKREKADKMSGVTPQDQTATKEQIIMQGRQVREEIQSIQKGFWKLEENVMCRFLMLPASLHKTVPKKDPVLLKEMNTDKKVQTIRSHVDLAEKSGMVKFSNVGPRAAYLKGQLARRELEISDIFRTELEQLGFSPFNCPEMFKPLVVEGVGLDLSDRNQIDQIEQTPEDGETVPNYDTLYFRGVSRLSFAAYLTRQAITDSRLPVRFYTVGRSYVPETSIPGNLPGLFGLCQKIKVEMLIGCSDEHDCYDKFCENQSILWNICSQFNLPIRLVLQQSEVLHKSEQIRADLEVWVPSLARYIKAGSVSMTGDYISRRLTIRCTGEPPTYMCMVHSNVDITTLLAVLMENALIQKEPSSS